MPVLKLSDLAVANPLAEYQFTANDLSYEFAPTAAQLIYSFYASLSIALHVYSTLGIKHQSDPLDQLQAICEQNGGKRTDNQEDIFDFLNTISDIETLGIIDVDPTDLEFVEINETCLTIRVETHEPGISMYLYVRDDHHGGNYLEIHSAEAGRVDRRTRPVTLEQLLELSTCPNQAFQIYSTDQPWGQASSLTALLLEGWYTQTPVEVVVVETAATDLERNTDDGVNSGIKARRATYHGFLHRNPNYPDDRDHRLLFLSSLRVGELGQIVLRVTNCSVNQQGVTFDAFLENRQVSIKIVHASGQIPRGNYLFLHHEF